MAEKTDEEIAAQAQAGNQEIFAILVERYESKLMRYAKRFLLNRTDAEDLVQNAFIKVYINIQSFDVSRRFSPWIYRIAHNEFVNAIKKHSGKEIVSFFDLDVLLPRFFSDETADAEVNRKELKEILNEKLDKLIVKYREPLVLYYYEDLDYREISEILKIPVSTVGVRLNRGRSLLEKMIKKTDI